MWLEARRQTRIFQMYSFVRVLKDALFFFVCVGLHPRHMEVPRLGVKSELQLLAYATATATATRDLSPIFDYNTAHSNTRSLTH